LSDDKINDIAENHFHSISDIGCNFSVHVYRLCDNIACLQIYTIDAQSLKIGDFLHTIFYTVVCSVVYQRGLCSVHLVAEIGATTCKCYRYLQKITNVGQTFASGCLCPLSVMLK